MKKFTALLLFAFILSAGSAIAGIIPIDPPQPANSWAQQWVENGMLPDTLKDYNRIVIIMQSPPTLEYAITADPGWYNSAILPDGTNQVTMWRDGSQKGEFSFITMFYGDADAPVSFIYEVYMNDTLLSHQVASWTPNPETESGVWSFAFPNNCVLPQIVPEASLVILLAVGIAGVVVVGSISSRRKA